MGNSTQPTLKRLAAKVKIVVHYGAKLDWDKQDEWQQKSNGYNCTLRYKGRQYTFDFWQGSAITEEPTAAGCLECLLSDASVSDDFEDFCGEFGYDTDSRKAERTHKACLKVREKLERLLGDDFDAFMAAERD